MQEKKYKPRKIILIVYRGSLHYTVISIPLFSQCALKKEKQNEIIERVKEQ